MTNAEISKELMVIIIRNGVELWLEKDRADKLQILMEQRKFLEIDGRVINTADIVGIFKAQDISAITRRKNGQWQGRDNQWHNKGEFECSGCSNIIPYGKQCGRCQ